MKGIAYKKTDAERMSLHHKFGMSRCYCNQPSVNTGENEVSTGSIEKQRLKIILFSDTCAITYEAKQKVVRNVVDTLYDILEIDSEDKVKLSVAADSDLGTIFSITVPVRSFKPEL
ncbi:hypothetical protein SADUNF_Sadunf17G0086800 [Salix dunnii]|uniref:Cell division topological specificity factor MinE n=1 Tax=Salix dunnii TaxID=1413687 RepID=A0A835MER9_9ROSI|nr:hypothetical protein SADUNF_Sadunf17G0086800 [Salix dunnii]